MTLLLRQKSQKWQNRQRSSNFRNIGTFQYKIENFQFSPEINQGSNFLKIALPHRFSRTLKISEIPEFPEKNP